MFSDHVQKIQKFPLLSLLAVAACLVILCQLLALALVVDRQVKRAELRDLTWIAQQVAITECIERSTGPVRHGCIQQARAARDVRMADDSQAGEDFAGTAQAQIEASMPNAVLRSALPVALATRQ